MAQRRLNTPPAFVLVAPRPIPINSSSKPLFHAPVCRLPAAATRPFVRPYTPLGSYPALAPCRYPRPAVASAYLPPPPPPPPRSHRPDRPSGDFGGDAWLRVLALWRAYNVSLETAPLRTKAATAAALNALADAIAQAMTGVATPDVDRVARFAVYGGLLAGPLGHMWFGALDAVVRFGGARGAIVKTMFDQVLFSPILISSFFACMAVLEGRGAEGAKGEVRGKLLETLKTSWKIWPFINMVNFGLIPPAMRVLFVNGASVAWIAFLSVVNSQVVEDEFVVASAP